MKLHTSAFSVLMADPGDVILLGIETGEGQRLQLIHDQTLLIFGRGILQSETDHAMSVGPFAIDAVDQILCPIHISAQNLRRGMIATSAIWVSEIPRNGPTPATPAAGELNQHLAASHARRAERPAPGRSRSASQGAKLFPRGNGGSQHGPAG